MNLLFAACLVCFIFYSDLVHGVPPTLATDGVEQSEAAIAYLWDQHNRDSIRVELPPDFSKTEEAWRDFLRTDGVRKIENLY